MKKGFFILFILLSYAAGAQDDECLERKLSKKGEWKKITSTNRTNATEYAYQKKFTEAMHAMVSSYQPRGLQAQWYSTHQPVEYGRPVASHSYNIGAMMYYCKEAGLELPHETNTGFTIGFNSNYFMWVFNPNTEYASGPGFDILREGIPEEIRPGVWQFKDVWTPLGFGLEGFTKLWLITYPGQLPWNYVTRREFLQKRRSSLLQMLKDEENRLQQNLKDLERTKKDLERVLKNDPAKYASYIKNDYEPAPKRFKELHDKSVEALNTALDRVNEQLQAPDSELNQRAIVVASTKNYLDFDFAEPTERSALILVKPNVSYFKKLPPSVPQYIHVAIKYYHLDSISATFAREMARKIDHDFLQSCIGKTSVPKYPGSKTAQNTGGSGDADNSASSFSTAKTEKNIQSSIGTGKPSRGLPSSPGQQGKGVYLSGTLSAPVGVPVTLNYNQQHDVTVTPPKTKGVLYSTLPIRFPKALHAGETYEVALKKIASNMKGVVYAGKGKAPEDTNKIRIGVDFIHELISRANDDKEVSSFYETFAPAVGGFRGEEGRYVVFISNTKGFAGGDGRYRQVYWRDRNTGITKLISVSLSGEPGNGNCGEPSISVDGQTVVFESAANNLVTGDNNNLKDVFTWNATKNKIELVSKSASGGGSDGESFDAAVSGNGKFVVFTSTAGNLSLVSKGRSIANVFLHDMIKGKTEMISVDLNQQAGGNGYKGSISFDGSRISFCSSSNTLVAGDGNNLWDIFVWQAGKKGLKRISLTHDGKERNGGTESASRQVASAISGNGKLVAFATTASNMVPMDNNTYQDVFVVNVETGDVQIASRPNNGEPSNGDSPIEQGERVAINFDGTWVAFPTKATNLGAAGSNIIIYNTLTGKSAPASDVKGSYVGRPAISYEGSYIVFGKSINLDNRFSESGIFAHFTGNGSCRDCKD